MSAADFDTIVDHLTAFNACNDAPVRFAAEAITNDGEPWVRMTVATPNRDGEPDSFGSWPLETALRISEALHMSALVAHSWRRL